jgi:hypothetical protein
MNGKDLEGIGRGLNQVMIIHNSGCPRPDSNRTPPNTILDRYRYTKLLGMDFVLRKTGGLSPLKTCFML